MNQIEKLLNEISDLKDELYRANLRAELAERQRNEALNALDRARSK